MTQAQIAGPRPNTMIGLTHTPDGRKMIREPKTLKVGIGYPRGKAADVFVDTDGAWNIRMGKYDADKKMRFETVARFPTKDPNPVQFADAQQQAEAEKAFRLAARQKAESAFRKAWKESDICTYPRKVAHFLFTRPVMGDDGAELYVPDFNAIEAHSFADKDHPGPPTEIDIVFLGDDVFTGGYQMWSSSELKCSGDGENALRVLSMASTPEEKALADEAAKAGKKYFPIVSGCWTCNCRYAKDTVDRGRQVPAPCKPGADIRFQLSRNIRVGGTAFFHTSSFRSIPQIFSSIERIKELTGGRIAGIPLKMVVRSHKTNHNNQPAIQQNVSIEFRAEDMDSLRKNLIEQAWKFRQAAGMLPEPAKMIEPADEFRDLESEQPLSAQAMASEFYADGEPDEPPAAETQPPPPPQQPAAAETQQRRESVSQKLKNRREPQQPEARPDPAGVEALPWMNEDDMKNVFRVLRLRVGAKAYSETLGKYGTTGDLKWTGGISVLFYRELKTLPDEMDVPAPPPLPPAPRAAPAGAAPSAQGTLPVDDF